MARIISTVVRFPKNKSVPDRLSSDYSSREGTGHCVASRSGSVCFVGIWLVPLGPGRSSSVLVGFVAFRCVMVGFVELGCDRF